DLSLEPKIDWASGMGQSWRPGESGAMSQMKAFLNSGLEAYAIDRDRPDRPGTSRLSPHLHFGEISSRQVWSAVHSRYLREANDDSSVAAYAYLREIAWREFAHHLLFHFPELPQEPLQTKFHNFPWRTDRRSMKAWTQGDTGYPLVDAGMRQLWHTGWVHNRVRMVVASFLVKHLLIPWQDGASWFWDTLVDADLANNSLGWQWVAGCGADAAPYFRIFNPVLQGEKFDPDGDYVRKWVPELARLSNAWIHKPWKAPVLLLAEAGVQLGKTYPMPIVDHETARKRALLAFASIRQR
ncbi:MAG: FAD-binding domain-containing protein, partial [Acidobacteriaceae bacterium]